MTEERLELDALNAVINATDPVPVGDLPAEVVEHLTERGVFSVQGGEVSPTAAAIHYAELLELYGEW
jgi:hypothetical protein